MKRLIALSLLVTMLLCGCTGEGEYIPMEFTDPAEETTVEALTDPVTQAPTEPPTEATEPPVTEPQYRHPLTGQALAEPLLNRPYAVVFDNDCNQSVPHWGVGDVDILWEMPHEGGTTRMIGVFSDVSKTDKLGPTRSVRPYLLSVARSFGAILVHAGGSPQGYSQLKKTKWDNLDGVQGANASKYYKRDKDRLGKVDSWHTMYITGENVLKYTQERGHENVLDQMADFGLQFRENVTLDGDQAQSVLVTFRKDGKKTSAFTYHGDTGNYTMSQFGDSYTDANTGAVVQFKNILVLETTVGTLDDYGRLYQELENESGKGYFATGGTMIPILWSRDNPTDAFRFTDTNGNPITLGVGKTYIAVVHKGTPVAAS